MIKIDKYKTVDYFNEHNRSFLWENKEDKLFHFYIIKNNKYRFALNDKKQYFYYDQDINIIKSGTVEHD